MAYSVDHMIRYMPELAITLTERYIQKITSMARRSHGPVCGMPYWQMLVEMMPILSRQCLLRKSVLRGWGRVLRDDLRVLVACCSLVESIATSAVEG